MPSDKDKEKDKKQEIKDKIAKFLTGMIVVVTAGTVRKLGAKFGAKFQEDTRKIVGTAIGGLVTFLNKADPIQEVLIDVFQNIGEGIITGDADKVEERDKKEEIIREARIRLEELEAVGESSSAEVKRIFLLKFTKEEKSREIIAGLGEADLNAFVDALIKIEKGIKQAEEKAKELEEEQKREEEEKREKRKKEIKEKIRGCWDRFKEKTGEKFEEFEGRQGEVVRKIEEETKKIDERWPKWPFGKK